MPIIDKMESKANFFFFPIIIFIIVIVIRLDSLTTMTKRLNIGGDAGKLPVFCFLISPSHGSSSSSNHEMLQHKTIRFHVHDLKKKKLKQFRLLTMFCTVVPGCLRTELITRSICSVNSSIKCTPRSRESCVLKKVCKKKMKIKKKKKFKPKKNREKRF